MTAQSKKVTTLMVEEQIFREYGPGKALIHNSSSFFFGALTSIIYGYGYFSELDRVFFYPCLWAGVATVVDIALGINLGGKYPLHRRFIHFAIWWIFGIFIAEVAISVFSVNVQ